MGGLGTEGSALILGFVPRTSNAVGPLCDYESHAIRSLPVFWTEGLAPSRRFQAGETAGAAEDWSLPPPSPISTIEAEVSLLLGVYDIDASSYFGHGFTGCGKTHS